MTAAIAEHTHEDHAHDDHAGHPTDKKYWGIAAFLGVVTAIEVYLSYAGLPDGATTLLMLIGMAIKFVVVAGFFMHLKFDKPLLRNLFISGFVLAVFCYVIALAMFRQFGGDTIDVQYKQSDVPGAEIPLSPR